MKRKVSLGGEWAKVGEDLIDGGMVKILDAGKEVPGEFGDRTVFKVNTVNGDKNMSFNQTTINNLIDAFGEDSENYIGQSVKVYVVKAMVSGKLRNVVYLAAIDWDMLDDGSFAKRVSRTTSSKTFSSGSTNEEGIEINYDV